MSDTQEENSSAQSPDVSGIKQKHPGGRHSQAYYNADVVEILAGTAKVAVRLLQEHINQVKGKKNLKPSLQRACEYVIDHTIGKSRQKIEHSGGILTYGDIAKSARDLDKHPRPILAEVEELANKYRGETKDKDGTNSRPTPD